jgi:uncharacterized membrane protein
MNELIYALTLIAALGSGLVAGWFFAYSNQIMKSLGRFPDAQGIAVMQEINIVVINPWAMTLLFAPALTCIALAVVSVIEWEEPEVYYRFAGAALYLVGAVLVTIAFNVPRNDAIAAVEPASASGADVWRRYLREWTAWNHLRTVAALGASALLIIALAEM